MTIFDDRTRLTDLLYFFTLLILIELYNIKNKFKKIDNYNIIDVKISINSSKENIADFYLFCYFFNIFSQRTNNC